MNLIHKRNIYINGNSLVIGDLGLAKSLKDLNTSKAYIKGTLMYVSPEVINREDYKFEVDIWYKFNLFFIYNKEIIFFFNFKVVWLCAIRIS